MVQKLLVVSERFWYEGGGGELATYHIIKLLRNLFDIYVITGTGHFAKVDSVKFIYEPLLSVRNKHLLWTLTLKLNKLSYFKKLIETVDIVYIPRLAFPIIQLAKRLNKKVIIHLHDYIPISYTSTILAPFEEHKYRIAKDDILLECIKGKKHCVVASLTWWLPKLAKKWISEADVIICVSKRQAYIISELLSDLKDKIRIVYNPIPNVSNYKKRFSDFPVFLYVGGGSYIKGFHVIVKALKNINNTHIGNAKILFANTYTYQQISKLMMLKRKTGLNIEVLGRINYKYLLSLHSTVWSLIFPSINEEPLPYAVLESMTLGTLPVASAVGGVGEIVENTYASRMLHKVGNAEELSNRIKDVLSLSREEIINISKSIMDSTRKKFNNEKIKRELSDLFHI